MEILKLFKDAGEELCKAYRGKEGWAKPQAKPPLEDPNEKKPPPYTGPDKPQEEDAVRVKKALGGKEESSKGGGGWGITVVNIQEGAAIWIRKLEEEMTGKTTALGDVKALLTKVVGKEKMLDIIENAGYRGADKSTVDGRIFDQYRQKIWDSLRKAYPTRPSTAMLKGVPMKEEESAAAFVEN
ncbi:hypothetical protein SKAU_G00064050 [Synaphobranchus kaupii]|uniref:Uncharacterized protein n=1 Tax=Synaphobranchus kaupii TaxID=118154 RepID=A0A9Q1JB13_SYNKA|nr:hypothetical protein SKAU_G00064050 [Synaphobranchus kaupii]